MLDSYFIVFKFVCLVIGLVFFFDIEKGLEIGWNIV